MIIAHMDASSQLSILKWVIQCPFWSNSSTDDSSEMTNRMVILSTIWIHCYPFSLFGTLWYKICTIYWDNKTFWLIKPTVNVICQIFKKLIFFLVKSTILYFNLCSSKILFLSFKLIFKRISSNNFNLRSSTSLSKSSALIVIVGMELMVKLLNHFKLEISNKIDPSFDMEEYQRMVHRNLWKNNF